MNTSAHDKLMSLLAEAMKRSGAERDAFVDAACGDDEALRREMSELLANVEPGDQLFNRAAEKVAAAAAGAHPPSIGPYRLIEPVGEGGMGVVYKAEQLAPIRRIVAIKLMRQDVNRRQVMRRFENERQALAVLDHPNIARVFDAGVTPAGRPYFAMEFVAGRAIHEYCDARRLSTKQRLELFIKVCDAVQHAHQKGIIHRDLKATNVLVGEIEGVAQPKVIDFGIAKALADAISGRTMVTEHGQLIGTLECMSPEQAAGEIDIDTRADVYSLGVMLYQLLTGALPLSSDELRSAGMDQARRMIADSYPPRPSERITALGDGAEAVAQRRGTSVPALQRELRSELEWIPLKAMQKDRRWRYQTVGELADDVKSYLTGRPLRAGPESAWYRARKLIWRRRWPLGVAAALMLVLMGGIATTAWQAIRAHRSQLAADAQAQIAQRRLNDMRQLVGRFMFDLHSRIESLAGSTPAMKMLAETSLEFLSRLVAEAGDDPDLLHDAAVAYRRVGDIQGNPNHANLGDHLAAIRSYQTAMSILQRLSAVERPSLLRDTADTHDALGEVLLASGDARRAMDQHRQALAIRERMMEQYPDNPELRAATAITLSRLGQVMHRSGDLAGAQAHYQRVLELCRESAGGAPQAQYDLSRAYERLGHVLVQQNDPDGAMRQYQSSLDLMQRAAASNPNDAVMARALANAHNHVGARHAAKDQNELALEHYKQSLAITQRLAQADPEDARGQRLWAFSLCLVGETLLMMQDQSAARAHIERAVGLSQALAARDPRDIQLAHESARYQMQLANLLAAEGQVESSVSTYRSAIAVLSDLDRRGRTDSFMLRDLAIMRYRLARVLDEAGETSAAVEEITQAAAVARRRAQADPADVRALTYVVRYFALAAEMHEKLAVSAPTAQRIEHLRAAVADYEQAIEFSRPGVPAAQDHAPEKLYERLERCRQQLREGAASAPN